MARDHTCNISAVTEISLKRCPSEEPPTEEFPSSPRSSCSPTMLLVLPREPSPLIYGMIKFGDSLGPSPPSRGYMFAPSALGIFTFSLLLRPPFISQSCSLSSQSCSRPPFLHTCCNRHWLSHTQRERQTGTEYRTCRPWKDSDSSSFFFFSIPKWKKGAGCKTNVFFPVFLLSPVVCGSLVSLCPSLFFPSLSLLCWIY